MRRTVRRWSRSCQHLFSFLCVLAKTGNQRSPIAALFSALQHHLLHCTHRKPLDPGDSGAPRPARKPADSTAGSPMALSFRQTEILDIARAEGRVVVEDLAERFDVTLQTIRRDLTDLADAGLLDRVHGGAVLRTGVANIGYEARRRMNEARRPPSRGPARGRSPTTAPDPEPWHHDRGRRARASDPPQHHRDDEQHERGEHPGGEHRLRDRWWRAAPCAGRMAGWWAS